MKLRLVRFGGWVVGRPFTGAWIETPSKGGDDRAAHVAPSRGRGLKRFDALPELGYACRPFTGAWIETSYIIYLEPTGNGRPFTGAWIETGLCSHDRRRITRRPFTGAWIETSTSQATARTVTVAPSRGRGLKHFLRFILVPSLASPLHGGVD